MSVDQGVHKKLISCVLARKFSCGLKACQMKNEARVLMFPEDRFSRFPARQIKTPPSESKKGNSASIKFLLKMLTDKTGSTSDENFLHDRIEIPLISQQSALEPYAGHCLNILSLLKTKRGLHELKITRIGEISSPCFVSKF